MSFTDLKGVKSLTEIGECSKPPQGDVCQLRIVPGPMDEKSGARQDSTVVCYDNMYFPYADEYKQSWDPSLEEYNQSVPKIKDMGYTQVCRTEKETSADKNGVPNKYGLFLSNPQSLTKAAGDSDVFDPCTALTDNGLKKNLSYSGTEQLIPLNKDAAKYLRTKFPSPMDGCSSMGPDGTYYYKLATSLDSLQGARFSITMDIVNKKLPPGVTEKKAGEIMGGLNGLVSKSPETVFAKSIEAQNRAADMSLWTAVISIPVFLGGFALLQAWSIKAGRKLTLEMMNKDVKLLKNPLESFKRDIPLEPRMVDLSLRAAEIDMALGMLQGGGAGVIFYGPAGYGKTAILYGLSDALAAGQYEDVMPNTQLMILDKGKMTTGTETRSSFETRYNALKTQIIDLNKQGKTVILGLDDFLNWSGAGAAQDVSGLVSELLQDVSDGKIKLILTATEEDVAIMARRPGFQALIDRLQDRVYVGPFNSEQAVQALKFKLPEIMKAEGKFPRIEVGDDALWEVVRQADTYLTGQSQRRYEELLRSIKGDLRVRNKANQSKAVKITVDDVRDYCNRRFINGGGKDEGSGPDDDPPPAPAGEPQPTETAGQGTPYGLKSAIVIPPGNLTATIVNEGVEVVSLTPKIAEVVTPEGFIMRVALTEESTGTSPFGGLWGRMSSFLKAPEGTVDASSTAVKGEVASVAFAAGVGLFYFGIVESLNFGMREAVPEKYLPLEQSVEPSVDLVTVYGLHTWYSMSGGMSFAASNTVFAQLGPWALVIGLPAQSVVRTGFEAANVDTSAMWGQLLENGLTVLITGATLAYLWPYIAAAGTEAIPAGVLALGVYTACTYPEIFTKTNAEAVDYYEGRKEEALKKGDYISFALSAMGEARALNL